MNPPRISVVMPVFNSAVYLAEAIESILAQTFSNFEFIIVDDGSSDDSPRILAEYAKKDARIRILRHDNNQGVTAALNTGIAQASAALVARMDADDISLPQRFASQVDYLDAHPETGVCGCRIRHIGADGAHLSERALPESDLMIRWYLLFENCLPHPSVIFRRDLLPAGEAYHGDNAQDYDLWVRLSAHTKFAILPEPLLLYRMHPDQVAQKRGGVQLSRSLGIVKAQLEQLLQEPVSDADTQALYESIACARSVPSAEKVIRAGMLIRQACNAFTARHALSAPEAALIRRNAAHKLLSLAQLNARAHPLAAARIFLRAMTTDVAVVRIALWRIRHNA